MKREVCIEQISDGKLYTANDMVKADCGDCKGGSACCRGMGSSIVLDPLDIYRLTEGIGAGFEELLLDKIELNVVDGIILPNLKMSGGEEACSFLNEEGRCSIHPIRTGICRLFPLGRYYENHGFRYFLQTHECKNENRAKVKVKKWLDTPDLKKNEKYICAWHYFLLEVQEKLSRTVDEDKVKKVNMFILQSFYLEMYHKEEDFYSQFDSRLHKVKESLRLLLG